MNSSQLPIVGRINHAERFLDSCGEFVFDKYSVGAWSPSKVKLAEKCPLAFYLKYVLKVKPDDDYVQDTAMADVGTIAHRILEHVVLGRGVDDAYKLTKREHCEVPPELSKKGHANITKDKWLESIDTLEANVITFKERMDTFERNNKVVGKYTELKLGVTRDWKKTTFFGSNVYFRGIIDLALEIETSPGCRPDLLILDHKHGGGEFGNSTRNYQQQLDSYKPMYHFGYNKVSGAQAGINFVKAGTSAYDEYVTAEDIEGNVRNKVEWVISGAIDTIKELGYFKHIRGNHCQYCEFDVQCKPGFLKEKELGTKKYFAIKEIK